MSARKLKLLAGCFIIFIGLAHSSIGDEWDDGDDLSSGATQLTAPTVATQTHGEHTLSNATDEVDWFKVTLSAGITYLFEATGSSDTEGFLYSNPSGSPEVSNSDDGEEGFNFLIVYTAPSLDDYYLKVTEWSSGDAKYYLNYKIALDAWDPGDDTGAGAALRVMDEYAHPEGPHSLSETDASDWYQFSLNAGNTYRFQTTGAWDTYGRLFSDPAGSIEVAQADNGGGNLNFRIDYTPSSSGNYYLQLSQTGIMENGEDYAKYDLEYLLIEDEWDPGDDVGTGATVLSPIDETLRFHGPHALSSTDEYDWFKVHLVAGETYIIESTGDSDTEGFLFSDSAGSMTNAHNDDFQPEVSSNFQIIYTPESTGNYYLQVKPPTLGNDAIYQLKYSVSGDLDGDGMPDLWEIQYFVDGTNAQPFDHGDSDTQFNIEEYIAGTDPTDSDSFFAVSNYATENFIVAWPSIAGREYRVLWANSLTNDFVQQGPMIDYPQNSYTDTAHNAEESSFYKVEVQLK